MKNFLNKLFYLYLFIDNILFYIMLPFLVIAKLVATIIDRIFE
jgi:hypothetical protein